MFLNIFIAFITIVSAGTIALNVWRGVVHRNVDWSDLIGYTILSSVLVGFLVCIKMSSGGNHMKRFPVPAKNMRRFVWWRPSTWKRHVNRYSRRLTPENKGV